MEFPGKWGTWGALQYCQSGGYAVSYRNKIESAQGSGDDTSMNGIEMKCSQGDRITSSVGPWGGWSDFTPVCNEGYTKAKVRVEKDQVSMYSGHQNKWNKEIHKLENQLLLFGY